MKRLILALSAMLPALWAGAAPYDIQHVEPLNWWVGMKWSDLQVMVHGEKIAELEPALTYPGVRIASVERTDNPNFLFVNLKIAAATKPGEFKLQFKRGKEVVTTVPYRLDARRKDSAQRRGFDAGDAIYLLVPDRFSNGDPIACDIVLVGVGAILPEVLAAAGLLAEQGVTAGVVCLTSPDLVFRSSQGRGTAIADTLFPAEHPAPLVTVMDGHPHTLAYLAGIRGDRTRNLGVTEFGQSSDVQDAYRLHGIDVASIVDAALVLTSR